MKMRKLDHPNFEPSPNGGYIETRCKCLSFESEADRDRAMELVRCAMDFEPRDIDALQAAVAAFRKQETGMRVYPDHLAHAMRKVGNLWLGVKNAKEQSE